MKKIISIAVTDFINGLRRYPVAFALAQEDVSDQHRRTTLGPAWLLLNYLLFLGTFIVIFGSSANEVNYPAYVALGLFVWTHIMDVIMQSATLFVREESFIKGTPLPLTVYILRMFLQSLIRGCYALFGCFIVLLMVGVYPALSWLWALSGIIIILAVTPAVIMVVAMLGAFFPDSQFIIQNLMRVGVFLTPIFWVNKGIGMRGALYNWDPFTYFIEIVRSPILDGTPHFKAIEVCVAIGVLAWGLAIYLLGRFRHEVVLVI